MSPHRLRCVVVFVISASLPIIPVTLRNLIVGHDVVLIASQGGVNFFIGNNLESNGTRAVVPGTRADWWGGFHDANRMAEEVLGRESRPSEISAYWYRRGLAFILDEPMAAVRLYVRKLVLLVGNCEISNEGQLYFKRQRSHVLRRLPVNFALILSLSTLAFVVLIRRKKRADYEPEEAFLPYFFVLPYAASVLMFFITSRYRLPVSVALVPPAAHALVQLWRHGRGREWATLARCAAVVVPVSLFSCANPYRVGGHALSRGYYDLGVDYANTNLAKALDAFNNSLSADPSFAPAWKMRGRTYDQLGRSENAIDDLVVSCSLDSSSTEAFYTLGIVYQKVGMHDDAKEVYAHVLELDPGHKGALNNTADVLMRRGTYEAALPYLKRALEVDPNFDHAIYGLGFYYETTENYAAAEQQYTRVLHFPAARLRLVLTYKKQGDMKGAVALLKRLHAAYPDAPDIDSLKRLLCDGSSDDRGKTNARTNPCDELDRDR